jgi:hypothetical protein
MRHRNADDKTVTCENTVSHGVIQHMPGAITRPNRTATAHPPTVTEVVTGPAEPA